MNGFNPRPREGATARFGDQFGRQVFQSTPPRRGDAIGRVQLHQAVRFNPRPREGATSPACTSCGQRSSVSIHAPAKGRPRSSLVELVQDRFNPRPREGATLAGWQAGDVAVFQSTPPRRGDMAIGRLLTCLDVSIHAPAKGRPPIGQIRRRSSRVSIHAPAKGRPPVSAARPACSRQFQSTPPRRGDRSIQPRSRNAASFQSTPPRRGDSA